MKSLYDISWKVSEDVYREDSALSYSTLAKYERSGFNGLPTLFDKVETPSLTFGSAVDAIITGGDKEFNERFVVADFPSIPDAVEVIVKELFAEFHITHDDLNKIPDEEIIGRAAAHNYQSNWKPETRARVIKEKASDYYKLLYISENKTLLSTDIYNSVLECVDALRTSEGTAWYFMDNNVFDDSVQRFYQLKFKANLNGVNYRCMMDECIVDHNSKIIYPIDLKTSSHKEWDFPKSFLQWNYQIQARLYYRILKANVEKDSYFKDFKIMPYKFIVVNKESLVPLVWEFPWMETSGDITFTTKTNETIILRDPFKIGKELSAYLSYDAKVPSGISVDGVNDLAQAFINM